jgi:hypothetical protein
MRSRIQIRIRIEVKSLIRIHIKVKSWIRDLQIRNPYSLKRWNYLSLITYFFCRFLYTGEYPSQEMTPHQIDLLISLGRECGVPNLLEVGSFLLLMF